MEIGLQWPSYLVTESSYSFSLLTFLLSGTSIEMVLISYINLLITSALQY